MLATEAQVSHISLQSMLCSLAARQQGYVPKSLWVLPMQ